MTKAERAATIVMGTLWAAAIGLTFYGAMTNHPEYASALELIPKSGLLAVAYAFVKEWHRQPGDNNQNGDDHDLVPWKNPGPRPDPKPPGGIGRPDILYRETITLNSDSVAYALQHAKSRTVTHEIPYT